MTEVKKFREKPKEVEARLFDGDTAAMMDVVQWVQEHGYVWYDPFTPAPNKGITIDPATGFLGIMTSDGLKFAEKGWWLYEDVTGEIKPAKAEVFLAMFEEVDEGTVVVPIETPLDSSVDPSVPETPTAPTSDI